MDGSWPYWWIGAGQPRAWVQVAESIKPVVLAATSTNAGGSGLGNSSAFPSFRFHSPKRSSSDDEGNSGHHWRVLQLVRTRGARHHFFFSSFLNSLLSIITTASPNMAKKSQCWLSFLGGYYKKHVAISFSFIGLSVFWRRYSKLLGSDSLS